MSLRLDDPQERKTKNRRFLYALRQARSWFVQLALHDVLSKRVSAIRCRPGASWCSCQIRSTLP
jgi:hypothetical protein